jgi:signal transduction histidine kinase
MADREAKGLQLVIAARLVYVALFAPADFALARGTMGVFVWTAALLAFVGICLFFLALLRRRKHVGAVGMAGAIFDVLVLAFGSVVWSKLSGAQFAPALLQSLIPTAAMVSIAINGLALRPRYPIIVTCGMSALLLAALAHSVVDPNAVLSTTMIGLPRGANELNLWLYLSVMLLVLVSGVTTAVLTWLAGKTIFKAVELERLNASLAESQVEAVVEHKISALTQLAAGVSHEINTPLGAMSSTSETSSRLVSKLRQILEQQNHPQLADNKRLWRALSALEQSTDVSHHASKRIQEIIETLGQFVRLDHAEREFVDVRVVLTGTLKLLSHQLGGRIKLQTRFEQTAPIRCHPKRLNQVFYTIIRNAIEAIEGSGTVSVTTREQQESVVIEVSDSGKGIAPAKLEQLFEIKFSETGSRIHSAMGLPIARSVVRRHNGTIEVESAVGHGTTFRIALPTTQR